MADQRRLGGLPLAVYVVALLILPLVVVAAFSGREVNQNNRAANAAAAAAAASDAHALTSVVLIPLEIERSAMIGLTRIDQLDVERATVFASAGLDFVELLDENAEVLDAGFDELSASLPDARLRRILTDIRTGIASARVDVKNGRAIVEDVAAVYDTAFVFVDERLFNAQVSIVDVEYNSPETFETVDVLGHVTDIVTTARSQASTFTSTQLLGEPLDEREAIANQVRHLDALDSSARLLPEAVARLRRQELGVALVPSVGVDVFDTSRPEFNIIAALVVTDGLVTHLNYLQEVGEFAQRESVSIRSQFDEASVAAGHRNQLTIIILLVVGLASALFGFVVSRSFAKPLNLLRLQAERITGGELHTEPIMVDGPSDIRKVTRAVNDMASTLALVEDHMEALAGADLGERPQLRHLPGHVGASMRTSMDRVTALTTRLQMSESRLAEEARIDNLTGLPNRFAVLEHLEGVIREQQRSVADGLEPRPAGVMFLDVDGFKSVNDTHGHAVGDIVLRDIARRLGGSIRDIDFVARLGGDEFIAVVRDITDPDRLTTFGERMIEQIEQPYTIGDQLFVVSASVGVTLVAPGDNSMSAIERADAAVYQAKRRGRRRVEMFNRELQQSIEHQAELELALRQAIQHNELRMFLQPIVDLSTGLPSGAEALVRWDRPNVGLVPPNEFIPIAERSGLIFELERWMLESACRRVAGWKLAGRGEGMRLAVNISGRHLIEGNLVADLDDAIAATGADANMLEIELTESQLLDDVGRASSVLAAIRDRGVKVAIDDFGTGYSSMTYLQKLPVDVVKIDRSFISSASTSKFDSTIVDTVVTIGRALCLEIVAEGIETLDQLKYSINSGVTHGQGFLLARPMAADDAEALIFNGPLFDVDRVRAAVAPSGSWATRPPSGPVVQAAAGAVN